MIFAFEEREVCGALGVFDWEFGILGFIFLWSIKLNVFLYIIIRLIFLQKKKKKKKIC
jgi:hypothetical protein